MMTRIPMALAGAAVLVATTASAQRATTVWADFGAGSGIIHQSGIALHLSGSVQAGPHLFTVRTTAVADLISAIIDAISGSAGTTAASDVGLLYGRGTQRGAVRMSVSGGVGSATIQRDSSGTSVTTHHFTVPLEAQLAWRPTGVIGLAMIGFASVNSRQSFGGLVIALQFGKLR